MQGSTPDDGACQCGGLIESESPLVMAVFIFIDETHDGVETYFIDVQVNGHHYARIGPFHNQQHRERCHEDLMATTRQLGAIDVPLVAQ